VSTRDRPPVFCGWLGTVREYDAVSHAPRIGALPGLPNRALYLCDLLVPKFGDFCSVSTRRELMRCWLRTRQFRRSGLDAREVTEEVVTSVTTGGEFSRWLRHCVVASQVGRLQSVSPGVAGRLPFR
jgi:hypothetical protein